MKLPYRADIDGLRAIAVLSVVFYHYGADGVLPGGFVGVDIFFVISGYLITSIIWADVRAGTFSFRRFYERRVLRIVPALTVMLLSVLMVGYFVLWPSDFMELGASTVYATVGVSNFYFFGTSNYFATASEFLPLLHTWSLGVEEQFYLMWPAVLFAFASLFGKKFKPITMLSAAIIVLSLAICLVMVVTNPPAAFFLPWSRAWELALGGLVAFIPARSHRPFDSVLGVLGLCLVLGSIALTQDTWTFPGWLAVPPCLGAALLIYCGNLKRPRRPLTVKLLSFTGLPAVGRISYSLYLWHWPILVLARQWAGGIGVSEKYALLTAVLAVSVASRIFVEKPFLSRGVWLLQGRQLVYVPLILAAAVVATSGAVVINEGFADRLRDRVAHVLSYSGYDLGVMFRKGECFVDLGQDVTTLDVQSCIPQGGDAVVLWGSSTIAQYYFGLSGPMSGRGLQLGQATGSGCRPIPGADEPDRPMCKALNAAIMTALLKRKPGRVVMGGMMLPGTDKEKILAAAAIKALTDAGIAVDVLGYSPVFTQAVPKLLAARMNRKDSNRFSLPSEQADPLIWQKDTEFRNWIRENTPARYVALLDLLCPSQVCELMELDGTPRYVDFRHMSREGSRWFAPFLMERLLSSSQLRPVH